MDIAFKLASQNHLKDPGNSYCADTSWLALYHRREFSKACREVGKSNRDRPVFSGILLSLTKTQGIRFRIGE